MMNAGGIARMDVQHGDLHLSLRAHGAPDAVGEPVQVVARPDGGVQVRSTAPPNRRTAGDHIVPAPMIGTFYTSRRPE